MRYAFRAVLCATIIAFGAASASAAPVVIDFDGFASNATIPVGAFDAQGVRFDQSLLVLANGALGSLPQSPPNAVANQSSLGGSITGFFLGTVTSVDFISVFAGDIGGDIDTVTLNGYNAANSLVDTAAFSAASAQTLSISGSGITRFEILSSNGIAIDNFTFNAQAAVVPEPASIALWSLMSVAGLAAWRRRRQTMAA